jgi:DNA-binding transcriptional MerR regulator
MGSAPEPPHPDRTDPLGRLDDPAFPALTMSQAAELLGVQAAFLRSLDGSGILRPHRSPGGHRRYSREQLALAGRLRELLDDGHPLASAEAIVTLQDELADARADAERLRLDAERLRSSVRRLRQDPRPGERPGPRVDR